jgi:hypothetical protein
MIRDMAKGVKCPVFLVDKIFYFDNDCTIDSGQYKLVERGVNVFLDEKLPPGEKVFVVPEAKRKDFDSSSDRMCEHYLLATPRITRFLARKEVGEISFQSMDIWYG